MARTWVAVVLLVPGALAAACTTAPPAGHAGQQVRILRRALGLPPPESS
jgi:hypothetical protein